MSQEFDYKRILLAYINHVGVKEGVSFISPNVVINGLTKEEHEELVKLDKESIDLYNKELAQFL